MNKYFKTLWGMLLIAALFVSCEEDGERLYLTGLESSQLVATGNDLVLSPDNSDKILLSLSWTKSALSTSNPNIGVPDVMIMVIQISTQNDFASNVLESVESNLSHAYTGGELNAIAKNLGLIPGEATSVYFRIQTKTGNNMESLSSNVVTVNITSYLIDMSIGFILDSDRNETGSTLISPESNGSYNGFMGVAGWYNFFFKESDGTIWGHAPQDDAEFNISSESDCWNFWFPEQSGCYYVNINTANKKWSALLLPALTVSGDINGDMIFDRSQVQWSYVFKTQEAGTKKIRLSAVGKQYNADTKTDNAAAIDTPVAFVKEGEEIILATSTREITIDVPEAGEFTLILDLSNPAAWKCEAVKGSTTPTTVAPYLYLPGIDDGISGSWTFDNYLTLYDEDNQAYAGVINVNSLWGYTFNPEKDNWTDKYALGEGDAYEGALLEGSDDNMPAPEAGVYLIKVSLKSQTYKLVKIGGEVYVAGLGDNWEPTPIAATETAGIFSGNVNIAGDTPWGMKILFAADNWDDFYGSFGGKIVFGSAKKDDLIPITPDNYTLTVNLIQGTYDIR